MRFLLKAPPPDAAIFFTPGLCGHGRGTGARLGIWVYRRTKISGRSCDNGDVTKMSAGFVTGGHDRDELVEEVAQCHDVRVSGHGAADALDGQASGPSQRWKAASMRPHNTPTSQPVRRHHTLGTLLATISTVSNGVPGGSNEMFGVWRRDAPDGCPNRHDDGMRN